jgi:hypothetical protein
MAEIVIAVGIGRILLHGIFYFKYGRILAGLGVDDTNAVIVLHGEIDVMEDTLAFASRSESGHRDCHTDQDSREKQYHIPGHDVQNR